MELPRVISVLNRLAPVHLAESWDNVGLLVEPSAPHVVRKLMLTNDLTEPVLDEALKADKVDLIVSYHPPIFSEFKRINFKTWKERILVRCLENRIAVYSPHTSFDIVPGGIADWFIGAFDVTDVSPISKWKDPESGFDSTFKITVSKPDDDFEKFRKEIEDLSNTKELEGEIRHKVKLMKKEAVLLSITCTEKSSSSILDVIKSHPELSKYTSVVREGRLVHPGCGLGRKGPLASAITLTDAIEAVKKHVGVKQVRVAVAFGETLDSKVSSVAVCCGSGWNALREASADLFVTGEMSHHELLEAVGRGKHVILTEHSNSERGFLEASLAPQLKELLQDKVEILVSRADEDPVSYF